MQQRIQGAKEQPHTRIEGGGHFIQEEKGGRTRPPPYCIPWLTSQH